MAAGRWEHQIGSDAVKGPPAKAVIGAGRRPSSKGESELVTPAPGLQQRFPIVLIAGIPGTGKSTFADWLAKNRGFRHLDIEVAGVLGQARLRASWDRVISERGVGRFMSELQALRTPVVITWSFPVAYGWVIDGLKAQGTQVWWFDGDRGAALAAFLGKGGNPTAFSVQVDGIDREWGKIERLFRGRMLHVVRAGPTFLSPDEICASLLGAN